MFELIKTLTELTGPVGVEDAVQEWVAAAWRDRGLDVRRTPIGNVLGHLGGRGPKLLIGAHADEICFRVKSIDDRGFIWLTTGRGGGELRPPEPVPLGLVAEILTDAGTVRGTFVSLTGHVKTRAQRAQRPHARLVRFLRRYRCAQSRRYRGARHPPGMPGHQHGRDASRRAKIVRQSDGRPGALALMTAFADQVDRGRLQYDVWLVSTVQEEIGLIGARSAAAGFDLGVIVEVGLAGDTPLVDPRQFPLALGAGPIVVHKDQTVVYARTLTAALLRCARTAGIPVQHGVFQNFSSDGREWIEASSTAMVAFPCRYLAQSLRDGPGVGPRPDRRPLAGARDHAARVAAPTSGQAVDSRVNFSGKRS